MTEFRLSTKTVLDAMGKKWIIEDVEEIEVYIRKFEKMVWFGKGNLQSIVNEWDTWGHEAEIDDITVLFGGSAGRLLITLSTHEGREMVTLIADESGGGGVGLQGIDTTKEKAIEMINNFIHVWHPFKKVEIKEAPEVMIA